MNKDVFSELSTLRAEVDELRLALAEAQAIAGPWQPCIEDVDLDTVGTMYCGTGLLIGDDCLMLPDGYAICKRNDGEYVTVHRSYIENLEAKIAALSK